MDWLKIDARAAARPRTYVLAALLVLTLVWAGTQGSPRSRRPGGAATPVASAGTPPSATEVRDTAVSPGWGTDPFAPKALAGRPTKGGETP